MANFISSVVQNKHENTQLIYLPLYTRKRSCRLIISNIVFKDLAQCGEVVIHFPCILHSYCLALKHKIAVQNIII